ncbi:MAG: penicillin-binding protein 1A [Noviherbaspirillum sp.]
MARNSRKPSSRRPAPRTGRRVLAALLALPILVLLLGAAYVALIVAPGLPSIAALTDYQPKIPLRVFTADNVLIGEFGEERRDFIPVGQIPGIMKNAVLAIEDNDFYRHGGVDFTGMARAVLANLRDSRSQGASTITMQVARNFFLTRDKTYHRKLQEILLAYRIEAELTKDQILELYMNQIYLGERAYGFGSAARVYFGKPLRELTVAEAAMLAGLPKAPSTANPVSNPVRARQRQQYILGRMRDLGYITPQQYAQAAAQKLEIRSAAERMPLHAEYAAEWVRQALYAQYKDEIYRRGFVVHTTLTRTGQEAAWNALRRGVLDYERRHGYRGPEGYIKLPAAGPARQQALEEARLKYPDSDGLLAAVVTEVSPKSVRAELLAGEDIVVGAEGLRFAAPSLSARAPAQRKLRPGAVVRVAHAKNQWTIVQMPEVAAAFVALDASDGAIRALVGGFDFGQSQFDHATQAWRQPGSTLKPFVYSAALEKGFSPATLINDAPLEEAPVTNGKAWNPANADGNYEGPMAMREALKRSRNLVSVRILQAIAPQYAQDFIARFGFDAQRHPANLTMALGTGSVTPLQMAGAYAVFANGGYRVAPYLIRKVADARGNVLFEADPAAAGDESTRVLDPRNAYLVDSMLRDVARSGTAAQAGRKLGRSDLAGKTGTTDDAVDGWFAGYGGQLVGVAWMGYDKPRSLGSREAGGTLALPIWIDFMREALRGRPESARTMPDGLVQADGDLMYREYAGGGAIRSLGVQEEGGGFWEGLFRRIVPAPSGAPVPGTEEKDRKRAQELYFG